MLLSESLPLFHDHDDDDKKKDDVECGVLCFLCIFQLLHQSAIEDQYLFHDDVFWFEPCSGDVWPNSAGENN